MRDILIRQINADDLRALNVMNDQAAPAVPVTTASVFARLIELSSVALVATDTECRLVGFILAIPPGLPYESENYSWFEERAHRNGTTFLYVDRIVIAPDSQGNGLGPQLYQRVFQAAAADGIDEVGCEVNLVPPNPGSLRFHKRLGFTEAGRQSTMGGSIEVALLVADVAHGLEPAHPGKPGHQAS